MNNSRNEKTYYQRVGHLLKEISAPARIEILKRIGNEDVCVCHLEANLGMKQAYLSQHLMALRKAGVLIANRDGRFIHYRLASMEILELVNNAAAILDIENKAEASDFTNKNCSCPQCKEKGIYKD
jgi:DNA-binding transcriptional ArsR family regulator